MSQREHKNKGTRKRLALEPLEARTLYSADIMSAWLAFVPSIDPAPAIESLDSYGFTRSAASANGDNPEEWASIATDNSASPYRLELVFIDENTPDFQRLIEDLQSKKTGSTTFEIITIGADDDGVAQITSEITRYTNVDAMHLIAHGSDGNVNIGNAVLNHSTFTARQNEIKSWGNSFTDEGDLLIYGCDFAASEQGRQLAKSISELTRLDVAASDDATGNVPGRADWVLEQIEGTVETDVPFSQDLQDNYHRTLASLIQVSTTDDIIDGDTSSFDALILDSGADGLISIREAVIAANTQPGADTITLPQGAYSLNLPGTYEDISASGDLDITSEITITGSTKIDTTISGSGLDDRLIEVHPGGNLTISDLTLQDGGASSTAGAAIRNTDTLYANNVVMQNNTASNNFGGAVWNSGSATLENVEILNNTAIKSGGIHNQAGATMSIDGATISGNHARSGTGGGVGNSGALTLENAAVLNNTATSGAGLVTDRGRVDVSNSTFSGNTAIYLGGGLFNNKSILTLTYSTISNNSAASNGAGLYSNNENTETNNSIFADNVQQADVGGSIVSGGYNIIKNPGTTTFSGSDNLDMLGTDPLLQPLAISSGDTATHAIITTSPAYNAGDPLAAPATDQRSAPRDVSPDIGAFELVSVPVVNQPPQLTLSTGNITYTENSVLIIDSALSVTDSDSGNFEGGVLTVASSGFNELTDRITINSMGTGTGEIDVSGSVVRHEGIAIGTWSGGSGSTPLQVTFNSTASIEGVTALGRNIAFAIDSDTPDTQSRTLDFSVTDGDGGTSPLRSVNIQVQNINDAPKIDAPYDRVFINEIHYDNAGIDVGENIEIAAGAGTDLTDWTLHLYSNGTVYNTTNLTGLISDESNGFGTAVFTVPGLQNGPSDGIALVDPANTVVEFLSYEGTVTATDGPAAGLTSLDIGVTEASNSPVGYSIQRTDTGDGFNWSTPAPNTFDSINTSQATSSAEQHVNEDSFLVFSPDNANPIAVSDLDTATNVKVTLSVTSGVMAFSSAPEIYNSSLTFTGSITDINSELNGLRYQPDANFHGADSLIILVDDQDSSSGSNETSTATISIEVAPVNDAPVLDNSSTLVVASQPEDIINPDGVTVAALLVSLSNNIITDADSGALEGIAVVNTDNSNGSWQYALHDSTTWIGFGAVSDTSAIVLDGVAKVRFVPGADYAGTSNISFKAWDLSDGESSGSSNVDVSTNGGITAYSSATAQGVALTVEVDDPPLLSLDSNNSSGSGQNNYQTIFNAGNSPVAITDTDIILSDVDSDNLSQLTIRINSTPDGLLETLAVDTSNHANFNQSYNGANNTITLTATSGTLAEYESILKTATYHNASTTPATADRTVTVTATDHTGLATSAQTIIQVVPDSIAPVITTNSVATISEGDQGSITSAYLNSTDDLQPVSALTYTITTPPTSGFIATAGAPATPITQFTQSMIDTSQIIYVHNGDETTADQFGFSVNDSVGNTINGNVFNVAITPVNDAPGISVPGDQSLNEDNSLQFELATANAISVYDPDATSVQANLSVSSGTLSVIDTTGTLSLTGSGTSSVTIIGNISTINSALNGLGYTPDTHFNGNDALHIEINDQGQSGSGGAITDTATINLTINPVNDAPTGTDTTITMTEDQPHTFTDVDFGFTDIENDGFSDILITSVPANGTLALSGSPITADDYVPYADIISGLLVFQPSSQLNGNGLTGFDFRVSDVGDTTNNGQHRDPTPNAISYNITPVNDPPEGLDNTISTDEDTAHTFSSNDFGFRDPIDGNSFLGLEISAVPASGQLLLNGSAVTPGTIVSASELSSGLLSFVPGQDDNSTAYTSFEFLVRDDGGTENNGFDQDQTFNTITVNVNSINDAPDGTDASFTILEDHSLTLAAADFGFNDAVDNNSINGVILSSAPTSGQLLQNGIELASGDSIAINSISTGDVIFVPDAGASGSPYTTMSFQMQDNGGTSSGGIDTDPIPNTLTFSVTSVSDAPEGSDNLIRINENTSHTFSLTEFGFSDPLDTTNPDELLSLEIAQLPSEGTLLHNGQIVLADQSVSATDISAGALTYLPPVNGSGTTLDNFSFSLIDTGNTVNGGEIQDLSPNTITMEISNVSTAPTGTDNTLTIAEDTSYTLRDTDFGYADTIDGDTFAAVTVTQTTANGTLELNGNTVTANQTISITDIVNGLLVFTPADDQFGNDYSELMFLVHDDGTAANGGQTVSENQNTLTFNVLPVSDAPEGTDKLITINEDTSHIFNLIDFGFSDPIDYARPDQVLSIEIVQPPISGTLTNNGQTIVAGQSITATEIISGALVYLPSANTFGQAFDNLSFKVIDSGSTSNGGEVQDQSANTIIFDITSVNDAPTGTDKTLTIYEDTAYRLNSGDFGFSDINDGNEFASVTITKTPVYGTFELNGSSVTDNQTISITDIVNELLVFTPFTDQSGNNYSDLMFLVHDDGDSQNNTSLAPNTLIFNVTSVNDAPDGLDTTIQILEDTIRVLTSNEFGFTDSESDSLDSVTIAAIPANGSLLINNLSVNEGDRLSAADIANGDVSYRPAANNTTTDFIDFIVRDSGGTLNNGTDTDTSLARITIEIVPVNDAPTASDNTLLVSEDSSYVFSSTDFGFSDLSDNHAFHEVLVSTLTGNGTLLLDGSTLASDTTIPIADIDSGLLVFQPDANTSGSNYATIPFQVRDSGGTSNGGFDTSQPINRVSLSVTPVNDAPIGIDSAIQVVEDTPKTLTASDFKYSDTDNHQLKSIILNSVPSNGTLFVSGIPATTGDVISVGMLEANAVQYQSNANNTQSDSITFTVQDNGGSAGNGIDTSTNSARLTFDITPVNDPPAGTDKTILIEEDTSYQFTPLDFGFSDLVEEHHFTEVIISSLNGSGTLTLGGDTVTVPTTISTTDLSNRLLAYTPSANAFSTNYASLDFQVRDSGGTLNNGIDLDPIANRLTIDVASVNDTPYGSNGVVTTLEDRPRILRTIDFGFSDPDNNQLHAIKVISEPRSGTLQLAGAVINTGGVIDASRISLNELSYVPTPNINGTDEFQFIVIDDGSSEGSNQNISQQTNTLQIDIAPVNDKPLSVSKTIITSEDTSYTFLLSDFPIYDPFDAHSLKELVITSLPAQGTLSSNGTMLFAGDTVSTSDIEIGKLIYTPPANHFGMQQFDFQVRDTGGVENGAIDLNTSSSTITIVIPSINDAPIAQNSTVVLNENTAYTLTEADFNFTDPIDTNGLQSVIIEQAPLAGTLLLNGNNVADGEIISAQQINSGKLVYLPEQDQAGDTYGALSFRVQDSGGTAMGGIDTSLSSYTITFNVLEVNHTPEGGDSVISLTEDEIAVLTSSDFNFNDAEDGHTFAAITVSAVSNEGSLSLNGQTVNTGDILSVAQIDSGKLIYTPSLSNQNNDRQHIGFQVHDSGNPQLGNTIDPTDNFIHFSITRINDAPTLYSAGTSVDEGNDSIISTAMLSAFDPDNASQDLYFTINRPPAHGQLTIDGLALKEGDAFTLAQLEQSKIRYLHDGSESDTDYFDFILSDGGEDGAQPVSGRFTINVSEVNNPAPELLDSRFTVESGNQFDTSSGDTFESGASSLLHHIQTDNGSFQIAIVTPPTHGTIALNTDGQFIYNHNGSASVDDHFVYRVTNEDGLSATARVEITITPVAAAATNPPIELFPQITSDTAFTEQNKETNEAMEVVKNEDTDVDQGNSIDAKEGATPSGKENYFSSNPDTAIPLEQETDTSNIYVRETYYHTLSKLDTAHRDLIQALDVRKHNPAESINTLGDSINFSITSIDLQLDVPLKPSDVINSRNFQKGLSQVENDLGAEQNSTYNRYQLGGELALGVSISTTAGILSWMLRGGALFGSLMASTPLWASIDPLSVAGAAKRAKDEENEDVVEDIFK